MTKKVQTILAIFAAGVIIYVEFIFASTGTKELILTGVLSLATVIGILVWSKYAAIYPVNQFLDASLFSIFVAGCFGSVSFILWLTYTLVFTTWVITGTVNLP